MDCINNGQGSGTSSRQNACLLATGEESLLAPPTVTIDQINPVWFMRVDENRGPAPSVCGAPSPYNVNFNTTTVYWLFYHGQSPNGSIQEVPLASYTGLRDNAHNTDLYWVSPGGAASFDGVSVPVDAGSPKSFELNLDTDIPDILVEPATGNRYIYLNVSTTSGSSKNGFDIWAGPATYTNSVPSQVNARDVHLLDNPNSHDSAGVVILASNDLPHSVHYEQTVERPLGYFGPEYAGQAISLTLFDIDVGSQAPLTFTFDTIAPADWSLTFGISGTIDPDGVPANSRCFPTCNNQFITPSYVITIPGGTNCNPPNCTPFYGGRLLMQFVAGINDNHLVSLSVPPAPSYDPHIGCNALPIAVEYGIRAVNPPGTGTGNDYPAPGDFEYPIPPPSYANFPHNIPDVPLQDAQEGYIYKIQNGIGAGAFAWLRWNNGINDSTTTLANSLNWPGNARDYLDYGDGGQPATPLYPYVVRGYVNPLDTSDVDLHINDWVIMSSGAANNTTVQDILNEHIDNGRLLRLPVWQFPPFPQGGDMLLPLQGFAIFRMHGYNFGQPASWILAEFIRWDDACGQPEVAPDSVAISGPSTGIPQNNFFFTASVSPTNTTQPITYTWTGSDQAVITHTSGITDMAVFQWPISGTKIITVTASNDLSTVTATHLITISQPVLVPIIGITLTGPITGFMDMVYGFTAVVTPTTAAQPITYTWQATDQTDITHTSGITDTAVFQWPISGTKTITVTASNDFSTVTATHLITINQPVLEPIMGITLTGPITGFLDMDYDFTAAVTPTTAAQPITYTWQATGQSPITHTGSLSDMVTFNWHVTGPQTITVTADNDLNEPVTAVHTITIETIIVDKWWLYLPFIHKP
jgi:hypothetical protein